MRDGMAREGKEERTLRRAMQVQVATRSKSATAHPPMMTPTCCGVKAPAQLNEKEAEGKGPTTAVPCFAHQFPTAEFDAEPPFFDEMITVQ